jgi:hypothetical protein
MILMVFDSQLSLAADYCIASELLAIKMKKYG